MLTEYDLTKLKAHLLSYGEIDYQIRQSKKNFLNVQKAIDEILEHLDLESEEVYGIEVDKYVVVFMNNEVFVATPYVRDHGYYIEREDEYGWVLKQKIDEWEVSVLNIPKKD